ncbi:MAG: hypothetical protein ACRCYU_02845 [Nocardioides sp.]
MSRPDATATAEAIARVQAGEQLTRTESRDALLPILAAEYAGADVAWGALLAGVHARSEGPQASEVLGFVDAILAYDPALTERIENPIHLPDFPRVVAITGSGKETFKTFNVSTAAALIAVCHPGLGVVKPAGRATSANTGSAEVLEHLGIGLPRSFGDMAEYAKRTKLCVFDYHLIAQRYGPRYEGRFHHLHPLSHVTPWLFVPVVVDALVFGISESNTALAAQMISEVGPALAAVVSTQFGTLGTIDEHAPFGTGHITTVDGRNTHSVTTDRSLPDDMTCLRQPTTPSASAAIIEAVLTGDAPALAVNLVVANAALILALADVPMADAEAYCRDYIASGTAIRRLHHIRHTSTESRQK